MLQRLRSCHDIITVIIIITQNHANMLRHSRHTTKYSAGVRLYWNYDDVFNEIYFILFVVSFIDTRLQKF